MSLLLRLLLPLLMLVSLAARAQNFLPVPPLQARVTDQVRMLDANQRNALENVLKDYEDRTGSQIAVLIVSKTEPEAIEQYGIRVFDAWKLGRKGVDDGVLLLVAKDNPPALRRLRIEAGRGVQGTLTDAQSKRILQDAIAPHFRQNDFYGGLVAGVSAISALLDQEHLPASQRKAAQEEEPGGFPVALFIVFVIAAIVLSRLRAAAGGYYTHRRGGWGGPGIILGGGFGSGGFGRSGGDFGSGGFGGGGFSSGGGTADGGGASGNW